MARAGGACILFAIESGSRAWGFPSPDSDYDCRFVYIRAVHDHLVLQVQRDVIEFPIEGDIDAGGWDLRKALLLALNGNAVISEWVESPYVYEEIAGFRARLRDLFERIVDPRLVARHYIGLLRNHGHLFAAGEVKLKKLFYALRPALALSYMDARDFKVLPPMDIDSLLAGVTLDDDLRALILEMIATKKITREMGTGRAPLLLTTYLEGSIERYALAPVERKDELQDRERYRLAEDFYHQTVTHHGRDAE